jgi:hypothetical protein
MGEREVRPSLRRFLVSLVIVVVIGGVAFLLIARENLAGMLEALGRADYRLVLVALGLYLMGLLLWAARWRVSLSAIGYRRHLRELYLVILGGIFITNITPFTYAGGDPVARSYLLKKTQRVPYPKGFATILAELMLDLPIFFSFLMLGVLASFFVGSPFAVLLITGIWLAAVTIFFSFFLGFWRRRTGAGKITGFVARVLRLLRRRARKEEIARSVEDFYGGVHAIIGRRRTAFFVSGLSVILWIFGMIRLLAIFQAFGYSPPIPMLMLAVTLPAIVGLVPLLPGGLGTVDVTIASVFLLFGVPIEIAISATLIERAITLVFGTVTGACVLSYLGVKILRQR